MIPLPQGSDASRPRPLFESSSPSSRPRRATSHPSSSASINSTERAANPPRKPPLDHDSHSGFAGTESPRNRVGSREPTPTGEWVGQKRPLYKRALACAAHPSSLRAPWLSRCRRPAGTSHIVAHLSLMQTPSRLAFAHELSAGPSGTQLRMMPATFPAQRPGSRPAAVSISARARPLAVRRQTTLGAAQAAFGDRIGSPDAGDHFGARLVLAHFVDARQAAAFGWHMHISQSVIGWPPARSPSMHVVGQRPVGRGTAAPARHARLRRHDRTGPHGRLAPPAPRSPPKPASTRRRLRVRSGARAGPSRPRPSSVKSSRPWCRQRLGPDHAAGGRRESSVAHAAEREWPKPQPTQAAARDPFPCAPSFKPTPSV